MVLCIGIPESTCTVVFIKIWMICVLIRGDMRPALWGADVGNSWRTTDDISDSWERSGLCIYL